jgi:hypothetical protein
MIEIWPHEFYFVAGLLIMAGLGLFLFTSAAGRVWCGYACPQTVWTDLFILVERWVEGDRNARIRLHRQKWDAEKIRKRAVKWTALAADRAGHRRRLGLLFHRCADAGARSDDRQAHPDRLYDHVHPDRDHLPLAALRANRSASMPAPGRAFRPR